MQSAITPQIVRDALDYDPATGVFAWRNPHKYANKRQSGAVAGSIAPNARLVITLHGKAQQAHRLAWMHYYGEIPPEFIDHADGNALNNSIANLRPCTREQNSWNAKRSARNSSGFKGVTYHSQSGKWRPRIRVHGKLISLGLFHKQEDAHAAYVAAAERCFGEFARAA